MTTPRCIKQNTFFYTKLLYVPKEAARITEKCKRIKKSFKWITYNLPLTYRCTDTQVTRQITVCGNKGAENPPQKQKTDIQMDRRRK